MVWRCIGYHGVERMFILEKGDSFNAALYEKVLKNRLILSANEWFEDGDHLFQDD